MKRAIEHLRRNDPVMGSIIERVGSYRIQYREPQFESLVRSIVYQQLSGRVASVILGRLLEAVKGSLTPESILKLRPARMRGLGLSTAKTAHAGERDRHVDGAYVSDLRAAAAGYSAGGRSGGAERDP